MSNELKEAMRQAQDCIDAGDTGHISINSIRLLASEAARADALAEELRALREQKPVAWAFKFNNGVRHVSVDEQEAADIRRALDEDETCTELYARSVPASQDDAMDALRELRNLVAGECPSLLDEDSGGDSNLSMRIDDIIAAKKEVE